MTIPTRRRSTAATARIAHVAFIVLLSLLLAACSGGAGGPDPSADGSGGAASPAATGDPGPAIDTDQLLRDASLDGSIVRVNGFFLAAADTAELCSIVMESYPPQCGGSTVRLTGEVPADVLAALDSTDEPGMAQATWGYVEVTGTYRASGVDGRPTIEIAEIVVAPPLQS